MNKRIVDESIDAPNSVLRTYTAAALSVALLARWFEQDSGCWFALALFAAAPIGGVVYLHYRVGREHTHLRWRWRISLSGLNVVCCVILFSGQGAAPRLDLSDLVAILILSLAGGGATHLIGLVVGLVADLFMDRVRRFREPHECGTCAYDLTGNTSGTCPECGSSVPRYLRAWLEETNDRSASE